MNFFSHISEQNASPAPHDVWRFSNSQLSRVVGTMAHSKTWENVYTPGFNLVDPMIRSIDFSLSLLSRRNVK